MTAFGVIEVVDSQPAFAVNPNRLAGNTTQPYEITASDYGTNKASATLYVKPLWRREVLQKSAGAWQFDLDSIDNIYFL